jgi:sec-independent protein translocase protein TatB
LPLRIYDEAMSFSDTVFLFFLALILFGPKKLPEMARQAGRLLAELRRASNEFKSQIETEIAHLEVQNKQTVLPPSPPPQATVASSNSATVVSDAPLQIESPVTLDSSAPQLAPGDEAVAASSDSTEAPEPAVEPGAPASQESHV